METMSNGHDSAENAGKKIFFLYPSAVIQNQIITALAQQEFEVYVSREPAKLRGALRKFPGSIVYVNLNDKLPELECEAWIKAVRTESSTARTEFGVISASDDKGLEQKYIGTLKLRGGFIYLKSSAIAQALKQLQEGLKTVEARGRRKHIRAALEDDPAATVNLPLNGRFVQGSIKDISVVGFSCAFPQDPGLQKNSLVQDIQIKLQATFLKIEGIVFGFRMDGNSRTYVILFSQRTNPETHAKIRLYIQQNLQTKMDKAFG